MKLATGKTKKTVESFIHYVNKETGKVEQNNHDEIYDNFYNL